MSAMIRGRQRAPSRPCARAAAVVALLAGALAAGSAAAASSWLELPPPQPAPQHLFSPPDVSLEQATETVRRYTGGRVLSASPAERAGARGYEVRVLVDGKRVRNVFVDHEGRIRSPD